MWGIILACSLLVSSGFAREISSRQQPVIGILTQPPGASLDSVNYSLVDSSYVAWLSGAGAVVVPILFNQTEEQTRAQFWKLDGVFLTGGPDKPTDFERYWKTQNLLYSLAKEHGQPLWGTCLGFQAISDMAAGGIDVLSDFNSAESELPLVLTNAAKTSRMFGQAPIEVIAALTDNNYTTNWHHYGISPAAFSENVAPAGYVALSLNRDDDGLPFVATFEHFSLPIYAVQWHPEANAHDRDHKLVNHSPQAVLAMQYLSNFFVNEARHKGTGPGCVGDITDSERIENYPMKRNVATWDDTPYAFNYVFV